MPRFKQKINFTTLGVYINISYNMGIRHKDADGYTVLHSDASAPSIYFAIREPLQLSTVVHEAAHAVLHILATRGLISKKTEDDEVLPYYLGYTVDEIVKFAKKKGIKVVTS